MLRFKPVDDKETKKGLKAHSHTRQLKARSWNLEAQLQYDTPQSNPSGSCEADKEKGQAEIYLATYNTCIIQQQDDLERLLEELEVIK
ncbi:hypothetical protein PoB_002855100 [Plakobranchus ocellatus]|uniref:Uncharacterized protein n=1 Tax=Plakobranchus ocellatus TaxID=259542 RepID=A0AAV4A1K7_9GAST|nr:hypothetical protein PoB_002855100 [Plakobranchus ocellatus]